MVRERRCHRTSWAMGKGKAQQLGVGKMQGSSRTNTLAHGLAACLGSG